MREERNIDALDAILAHEPKPPTAYMNIWHLVGCKGALGDRGSYRDRIAATLTLWVAAALMRNPETRKMFCLAISSEMVRTIRWLDEKPPSPPPAPDDR